MTPRLRYDGRPRGSRRALWLAVAILTGTLGCAAADCACGPAAGAGPGYVVVTPPPYDVEAGCAGCDR